MLAVPIHAAVMPEPQFPDSRPATVIRDLDSNRLVNIPGEIAAVDIFANFATELVLVQKFAHGLLETGPYHATHARNCKEEEEYGDLQQRFSSKKVRFL